ncbi:MAG: protein-methionine-sulfoxide reductase catalytic subunit MsrP [Planctomycetota bacterium]|nr:MAG: protein-methionine-sulfoxide reductase catalytic subunit MsrP [Planctomycetota bacterium]
MSSNKISVTPEDQFLDRRSILRGMGMGLAGLSTLGVSEILQGISASWILQDPNPEAIQPAIGEQFKDLFPAKRSADFTIAPRTLTPEGISSIYNNFYEFTSVKNRVWRMARNFKVVPWKIEVAGAVEKPLTLDLDDLMKVAPLEERLYRFRCVETWAMQVPWIGYPLNKLIDRCKPLGKAKYIRFISIQDEARMPGQRDKQWPWPYFEALRLDEARHPLAMVVVGLYGHGLPMQHGAPWRVVVPWKYGYKSPKSIVRIEFTEEKPATFWNQALPREYGFYSNVNPSKPHPRWSQAMERDIGTGKRRPTLLYNGYAEQVAKLYSGKEV